MAAALSEHEPSAVVTSAPTVQQDERPFHQLAELRHDQRHRQYEQEGRADLDLMLRADPEQSPQPRAREQERREGGDETGRDGVRPPLRSSAGAAGQHDRQHGKDAGRERGDDARRERDRDEDEHPG